MSTCTLSEHESKALVAGYGIPLAHELRAADVAAAAEAAAKIGYPVVLKLNGDAIAHKSERGLVKLGLSDRAAVVRAADELLAAALPEDGEVDLLVAEQVAGKRELIAGLVRDPQFGPCVLLGLGGVLAEALEDVAFAAAPLTQRDALRLVAQLDTHELIEQPFRGEPAADLAALAGLLVALGRIGIERDDIASVDLNPVILNGARPVAVDALVELNDASEAAQAQPTQSASEPARVRAAATSDADLLARFRPLFHPKGIAVAGASSHPGKFGFVSFHNLIAHGYEGELYGLKPDGAEVLGHKTLPSPADLPEGAVDLVFVCTPAAANEALLRGCAARGVKAAFIASAGYGEAGEEGRERQKRLVELADELDMLIIGPNGQGVVSTAASMCAQIVAPYPPAGRVGVVSQSGNLVSAYMNYAVQTGVGVSKAIALGNCAQTDLADLLDYFSADADTAAVVAYVEGVGDGRRFRAAAARLTARKPLVLVKGGAAAAGQRAAASHTGALASDDNVFDGVARQAGALRATTIEEAFEWAASFASQPLPRGRRTLIFTSVGGWGVLAADACAANGLEVIALPEDLRAAIDALVPPRWSRNNPIDLAGGETRDTIPTVLDLIAKHPDVDGVIHLGVGIQAATANALKTGPFYPDHGLERMVAFHEAQDRRYALAAAESSQTHGVPILSTTELVYADRAYGNSGPLGVREAGRVCYPSAHRAVRALRAMVDYEEYRAGLEG